MSYMGKKDRKKARPRRKYTDEFKAGAVRLVLQEGQSAASVARDLDLTESALSTWVQQARRDKSPAGSGTLTTDERAELTRLRRDNRRLEMEREILKKATAFFAKEST